MSASDAILALDQGTTSSRAIVFDARSRPVAVSQEEFPEHYPGDGRVEHDPEDLWVSSLRVARDAAGQARAAGLRIVALGLTNQRETTLVWDRATGEPIHPAIVWQDRRTADECARLRDLGHEASVTARTGLVLDPYFSATKIAWILDNVPDARRRAERGELAFGTVDSWLLWRLTGARVHATDATNAARTLLFDIHRQDWDDSLLTLFRVPRAMLGEVRDCADDFGVADPQWLGEAVPIRGVAGDQHAAMIGQACFREGMVKATYGTGCFALLHTGTRPVPSRSRLLTTPAYRLEGRTTYALEGAIFIAGAAVQWLRDGLGIIDTAAESESLAATAPADHGVHLVPAFTGLGAPYWDADARGAVHGISRDTGRAALARAALESVAFQTHDLIAAMGRDTGHPPQELRIDGGMVVNNLFASLLADLAGVTVRRPVVSETTALGAAYLAGLHRGVWSSPETLAGQWREDREWHPRLAAVERDRALEGWHDAVRRTLSDHGR
ncbi:MAG: glycerol kinase GlpK [Arhodomonas sp.]|nr:glycerol kinase GlpK [Arhodomonas sp.]